MSNYEKIVSITDAVLDCIPIVSSISNVSQALYKLAHKVDALNPVKPGLKTSIKIHVLSKSKLSCFVGFVPILGNILKLLELVYHCIFGFKSDRLLRAISSNNEEIIHLSIGNYALEKRERADILLEFASTLPNTERFAQILNLRKDWGFDSLMKALKCYKNDPELAHSIEKANHIFDYLERQKKNIMVDFEIRKATAVLEELLKDGKVGLAERFIKILKNDSVPFSCVRETLFLHAASLTDSNKQELINKIKKPTLVDMKFYLKSVTSDSKRDHKIHYDTLNKLLVQAELKDDEIGEFISFSMLYNEFDFSNELINTHENQLTEKSRREILNALLLPQINTTPSNKRQQLQASLTSKWPN